MNLIQRLLALLNTSELLERFSGMIGEPIATTEKGLAAAVPAIFGGLMSRGSSEAGAGVLIRLMADHKIDGGMLDQLAQLFGGRARDEQLAVGHTMLRAILGEKTDAVTRLVSAESGMPATSAGRLTALAAPAVLGGIASVAPAGGFTVAGLMGLLASQKGHLAQAASTELAGVLGLGALGVAAAAPASVNWASSAVGVKSRETVGRVGALGVAAEAPSFLQVLWPWLLLATLLWFALSGLRACSSRSEAPVAEAPVETAAAPVEEPAPEPVASEPQPSQLTLPSGNVISVVPGSIGENLYNFLIGVETGSKTFQFDGLRFNTNSATLDESSQATITAIAEILKEFGAVAVSVDGYTDNSGSKEANVRLSQARAQEVRNALIAAGVDGSRIGATGHGDDNPIADNGSEEGRAMNRRTELTATKS